MLGFGCSVVTGGLISGYSFAASKHVETSIQQRKKAFVWFYVIAAGCGVSLMILSFLKPYSYPPKVMKLNTNSNEEKDVACDDYTEIGGRRSTDHEIVEEGIELVDVQHNQSCANSV